jgi:hypothetical protein
VGGVGGVDKVQDSGEHRGQRSGLAGSRTKVGNGGGGGGGADKHAHMLQPFFLYSPAPTP